MAKNIQMKIEIPIPLARSLLKMAANIAKEVKITDRKTPVISNDDPAAMEEYNNIGIPHPTKKAKTSAVERPKKRLNQTFPRGTG